MPGGMPGLPVGGWWKFGWFRHRTEPPDFAANCQCCLSLRRLFVQLLSAMVTLRAVFTVQWTGRRL